MRHDSHTKEGLLL